MHCTEPIVDHQLEVATDPVHQPPRKFQVPERMGRPVVLDRMALDAVHCASGSCERGSPAHHKDQPFLGHRCQMTVPPQPNGRGHFRHNQRGRSRVRHHLGALDTIEKGEGLVEGHRRTHRPDLEGGVLDKPSGLDARIFEPARRFGHGRGGHEAASGQ